MHQLVSRLLWLLIEQILKQLETVHNVLPLIVLIVILLDEKTDQKVPNFILNLQTGVYQTFSYQNIYCLNCGLSLHYHIFVC